MLDSFIPQVSSFLPLYEVGSGYGIRGAGGHIGPVADLTAKQKAISFFVGQSAEEGGQKEVLETPPLDSRRLSQQKLTHEDLCCGPDFSSLPLWEILHPYSGPQPRVTV